MTEAPPNDSQENLRQFGRRVRSLRTARSLSQEQLAHDAGLHRAVIGFIERGERDVGISHVWPLATALGVSVTELFEKP
ncbi:helix-turn-helix domain-containing protein [Aeromicrobium sp. CF4.19]|uniref:helix-turn-helix domain-containing protein n=1 Tax=Aeromicrobium sp. CF4.19 TaxID=3373082 RepID=UPI003EE54D50